MSTALKTGIGNNESKVENFSLFTTIKNRLGNTLGKRQREQFSDTDEFITIGVKNDSNAISLRGDKKGNLITGNYIPELIETFAGTTGNAQKWTATSTTFVPAQTTIGGYNFNNTNLLTASAVSILQSQRVFYKIPRVPLQYKQRIRVSIPTNSVFDMGFGIPSGTTITVPNGCAIRCVNGLWSTVITYNGVEIATLNITELDGITQLSTSSIELKYYVIDLILDDDNAVVTIQDTNSGNLLGKAILPLPLSAIKMWGATALPVYTRLYNTSVVSTAPIVTISELQVLSTDMNINMDASQIAGNLGLTAGRNPFSGSQLENHVNSTAPTSATLSNIAQGYNTLGGRFQFLAVAEGATDYALFGFQVPTGSKFLCEGVKIETYNTVVPVATTATVFEWSMGFNSGAVSLATANIIRRQVGVQTLQVGAAVGQNAAPIDLNFQTPEIVESGRFVHVILNIPVGTATPTEIFRGQVLIKGRFI